jgi:hypothetical protein
MLLAAGIHLVIRNAVIRFIVKLILSYYVAPFQITLIAKRKNGDIISMISNRLVTAATSPPPP